jgi:TM2 domain-containing membrane protein YozV
MRVLRDAELLSAAGAFETEDLAAQLEDERKKRRYAYLAWLCLGSHYLYLGRPRIQALFWLTGGGLLLWWLIDLTRISALVERHNRDAVSELLRTWQLDVEQRLRGSAIAAPRPVQPLDPLEEAAALAYSDTHRWNNDPSGAPAPFLASGWSLRPVAGLVLAAAMISTLAIHILTPRTMYPPASSGPSFRTVRQANVRVSPSTASPVRATVEKNVTLRGHVREVAGERPSTWLRISRGAHAGGFVALQNLKEAD